MGNRSGALSVLVVVSGPSGAGKGTIVRRLLEADSRLWLSVSATTRAARPGEIDGVSYFFMSRTAFEAALEAGEFLESFEVFGNRYGTPAGPIRAKMASGLDVVLEIDVQGALAVRRQFPQALLVFVKPPNRTVQRQRLLERGTDDRPTIERRLAKADAEEAHASAFDLVVVNAELDQAVHEVRAAIEARRRDHAERPGPG